MLRTQRAQRRPRQVHQPKLQHQCVLSDHFGTCRNCKEQGSQERVDGLERGFCSRPRRRSARSKALVR